jgi:hypothetical protein
VELLLYLTDLFLSLLKVLIYGSSLDPSSGPPLYSQVRRILLSGDAIYVKLPITSGDSFWFHISWAGGVRDYGRAEDREQVPEQWRCSLIEAEPKLSQALIWRT